MTSERDGGTEVEGVHENLPPGVSASDNELGWRMSLGKLARRVEESGAAPMLALLPSPLLGPAAWEPAADALRGLGFDVLVAPVPASPESPAEVLAAFVGSLPTDRQFVLVPHSNAGLYVPALTAERTVVGVVFVDAALPDDAESTAMAPAGLRAAIAPLAGSDGLLPPWTQWWDEADVAALFPSPVIRLQVSAAQPTLPLSYFDASLPVPTRWDETPCAYLAFGDTYADELARAVAAGWPVSTLTGHHLHLLAAPAEVAAEVLRLLEQVSGPH